jgi:hypothetical protein
MMTLGFTRFAVAAALVLTACGNGSGSPVATPTADSGAPVTPAVLAATSTTVTTTVTSTTAETTTTTAEPFVPQGTFRVVVIVDLTSEDVSREEAQALVDDASAMHQRLSGFSVEMVDYIRATPSTAGSGVDTTRDLDQLVYQYEHEHFPDMPDGFMIISYGHDGAAAVYGGYSYLLDAPADHKYRFISTHNPEPSYHIGVVHFRHRYAQCGYGGDTLLAAPIQETSSNGECFNQDGTPCVEHNGYAMCATAVSELYASTLTYFAASSIVHEIMHGFGVDVETDHYGNQACTEAMTTNGSARGYEFDGEFLMFELYNGICPFLYDQFIASYVDG